MALPASMPAAAETVEQTMEFAGNKLEIVQTDDFDRVLKINGDEAFRDFQIYMERTIPLGGREVLLVSAGPGGNACGSYPVVLIPGNDGTLTVSTPIGKECGRFAEVAATTDRLIFLGHPTPGNPATIDHWWPRGGLEHVGRIEFEPQPDTGWANLDGTAVSHPLGLFSNADVYRAIEELAGTDLGALATSLGVAGEPQLFQDRFLIGMGCTPHACGAADGFIAVDLQEKTVYAATDATEQRSVWPSADQWPDPLKAKLEAWGRGER
jgi:hypothetical protein